MGENMLNEEIKAFLSDRFAADVGFCDCTNITPFSRLSSAVSVVFLLSDAIVDQIDDAPTHTYFHHYRTMNAYIDSTLLALVQYLLQKGYNAAQIPASQSISGTQGLFAHKTAAVLSGLGYIGKSALFISHKYGPRVRLGTVFTDAPLDCVKLSPDCECGDCDLCAKACGAHAIKNVAYKDGMSREDIFDAQACSDYMKDKFKHIGRGAVCGVCMRVCPKGLKKD